MKRHTARLGGKGKMVEVCASFLVDDSGIVTEAGFPFLTSKGKYWNPSKFSKEDGWRIETEVVPTFDGTLPI